MIRVSRKKRKKAALSQLGVLLNIRAGLMDPAVGRSGVVVVGG